MIEFFVAVAVGQAASEFARRAVRKAGGGETAQTLAGMAARILAGDVVGTGLDALSAASAVADDGGALAPCRR